MPIADEKAPIATVGGEKLGTIIRRRRDHLVDAVLEQLVTDLSAYSSLPPELLDGDITNAVKRGIDLFLTTLATGEPLGEEDLIELGESAARRAEERIPLASVLRAYLTATRVVLREVTAEARPDELAGLVATIDQALAFLQAAGEAVVDRYVDESEMITDDLERTGRSVLAILVTGMLHDLPPSTILAESYTVLHLTISPHPDELDPAVSASIAARRKLRRLRTALTSSGHEDLLSSLGPEGGLVLVGEHRSNIPLAQEELSHLVATMSEAAGADLHVAAVRAKPEDVSVAATLAKELLELADLLGRPPGLHLLSDMSTEYQVTRPGPARKALAATLAPLTEKPELLRTLGRYLDTGLNRRQTALDEHVHPNTVDYRLRRTAALVGLDPTDRNDALRLNAALLCHAAELRERAAAG